jgi:hypothetical protein
MDKIDTKMKDKSLSLCPGGGYSVIVSAYGVMDREIESPKGIGC